MRRLPPGACVGKPPRVVSNGTSTLPQEEISVSAPRFPQTLSSASRGVSLASVRGLLARSVIGSPRPARASRLLAVWRPAPICLATSPTPSPPRMRATIVSRPLGVSLALGCWHMGGPLSTPRTWTIHSFAGPSLFVTLRA